jgi:hypothetical protein
MTGVTKTHDSPLPFLAGLVLFRLAVISASEATGGPMINDDRESPVTIPVSAIPVEQGRATAAGGRQPSAC